MKKIILFAILIAFTTMGFAQADQMISRSYNLTSSTNEESINDSKDYVFQFSTDTLLITYKDGDFDVPLNLVGRFDYIKENVVLGHYRNEWDGELYTFTFTSNQMVISYAGSPGVDFYINVYTLIE